jgi:hypothetical protein
MNTSPISEAIANIVSTSQKLEEYCNDPKNYNTSKAIFLEEVSWDLQKRASELKEFLYMYGS